MSKVGTDSAAGLDFLIFRWNDYVLDKHSVGVSCRHVRKGVRTESRMNIERLGPETLIEILEFAFVEACGNVDVRYNEIFYRFEFAVECRSFVSVENRREERDGPDLAFAEGLDERGNPLLLRTGQSGEYMHADTMYEGALGVKIGYPLRCRAINNLRGTSKRLPRAAPNDMFCHNMISTIALDLDGTLFNESGEVSDGHREALERAAAAGIHIILCSGRHHLDVSWLADQLDIVSYIVSSNGASLTDASGKIYRSQFLEDYETVAVAEAFRKTELHGIWYTSDGIVLNTECPVLSWYKERDRRIGNRLQLSVESDAYNYIQQRGKKVLKIAVNSYESDPFTTFEAELRTRGISWTNSSPYNREIMAKGTSKAVAVGDALELLGTPRSELVAVGDGMNDIELCRFAGYGIAMGNACAELKAAACGICPPNSEDGVAVLIDSILAGQLDEICANPITVDV